MDGWPNHQFSTGNLQLATSNWQLATTDKQTNNKSQIERGKSGTKIAVRKLLRFGFACLQFLHFCIHCPPLMSGCLMSAVVVIVVVINSQCISHRPATIIINNIEKP